MNRRDNAIATANKLNKGPGGLGAIDALLRQSSTINHVENLFATMAILPDDYVVNFDDYGTFPNGNADIGLHGHKLDPLTTTLWADILVAYENNLEAAQYQLEMGIKVKLCDKDIDRLIRHEKQVVVIWENYPSEKISLIPREQ